MKKLLIIALAMGLAACGGTGAPTDPGWIGEPIPNFPANGTFEGTVSNQFITANIRFVLIQQGANVTGELYTALQGGQYSDRGPITGTLDATTLTLKANVELGGVYTFMGPVTGDSYTGNATYVQSTYGTQQATFTTKRQ